MNAVLYTTDNNEISITPQNGKCFELEELYSILRCELIEVIDLNEDKIMIIDEEGKFTNPIVNRNATEIAIKNRAIYEYDYIAGMAIVCDSDMLE